jgi:hypothetical protein
LKVDEAYRLGHETAASGFFFDGMEMVAAASTDADGGIDALRGAVKLIFAQRDRTNECMTSLAATVGGAFGAPVTPPRTVDEYRSLMTKGVFEIVNRWSYISDIKLVTRLQAWFYCGFGLGRAETATRGVQLFERLREIVGAPASIERMPPRLGRLAAEAGKQLGVAAEEDDLRSVRPLLEGAARRVQSVALLTARPSAEIVFTHGEDLEFFADTDRKIRMDLTRT